MLIVFSFVSGTGQLKIWVECLAHAARLSYV